MFSDRMGYNGPKPCWMGGPDAGSPCEPLILIHAFGTYAFRVARLNDLP